MDSGPDVGTLMVGNHGDKPVLVLEGQLFESGWQHRMATESVMVGVHQRMPVSVACLTASNTIPAGSPPSLPVTIGTPTRSAQVRSWPIAAARKVSPAASMTP